jgi:hypothetical protein
MNNLLPPCDNPSHLITILYIAFAGALPELGWSAGASNGIQQSIYLPGPFVFLNQNQQ